MLRPLLVLLLALSTPIAGAVELKFDPVAPGIYAFIGELGGRTAGNEGMNTNTGFVVTGAGVVVIDSGSTYEVAKRIHAAIQRVTNEPVKYVINTGGQDHRWLGNGYFKSIGAEIIAQRKAVPDMQERGAMQLDNLKTELKGNIGGTEPVYPTRLFEAEETLKLGSVEIRILHIDTSHTPGDSMVWLPQTGVIFTGDVVYVDRLLAVIPVSSTRGWAASFDALEKLQPKIIVPGHGQVCDLAKARRETRDYLTLLRAHMKQAIKNNLDLQTAIDTLDQSAYKHLVNWDLLKGGNASRTYLEMEME